MQPSCLVPTVQTCKGGVIIWGHCSWAALASATLCDYVERISSVAYLNFPFPDGTAIFQDDSAQVVPIENLWNMLEKALHNDLTSIIINKW